MVAAGFGGRKTGRPPPADADRLDHCAGLPGPPLAKEPHRPGIPWLPAVEPYDGEDELHPEDLVRIRRGPAARGLAVGPCAASHGRALQAGRPSSREDLPRLADAGPAVRFPGTGGDSPGRL